MLHTNVLCQCAPQTKMSGLMKTWAVAICNMIMWMYALGCWSFVSFLQHDIMPLQDNGIPDIRNVKKGMLWHHDNHKLMVQAAQCLTNLQRNGTIVRNRLLLLAWPTWYCKSATDRLLPDIHTLMCHLSKHWKIQVSQANCCMYYPMWAKTQ